MRDRDDLAWCSALGVVPEAHVGEQGDGEKDCRDPTADVGDEGQDLGVPLVDLGRGSGDVLTPRTEGRERDHREKGREKPREKGSHGKIIMDVD